MAQHAIQIRRGDPPPPAAATVAEVHAPPMFAQMPGRSAWFDWHRVPIHSRHLGSGPPLVLVHSVDVGASHFEWRRVMEPLAENFTVVALDLPGFGLSGGSEGRDSASENMRCLAEFLHNVQSISPGQAPVRVLGSGTGASYLAVIAAESPHLVGRMALIAPTGLSAYRAHPLAGAAYSAIGLPGVTALRTSGASRATVLEYLQHVVYADDVHAGMNEADARHWVATRPSGATADRARIAGLLNVSVRPAIARIEQPLLLTWGRGARKPPVDDAEVWRELKRDTAVVIFERSAHCPHVEEAPRFAAAVREFLMRDIDAYGAGAENARAA